MNIGQLAQQGGTTTDTIRYYEKQGLLAPALRRDNGYRSYTPDDVARIRFIRTAKALGFTLQEIVSILPGILDGDLSRLDLETRLHQKLQQIDDKIAELQRLRGDITGIFSQLTCAPETALKLTTLTR